MFIVLDATNILIFFKGGPCTEIHYDRNYDLNLPINGANLVNKGTERVIELWNIGIIFYGNMSIFLLI